ncbi:hypothetical protein HQ545_04405 [Candidatus Woesearchaeota archaeon]|nr:hypothetical protein [Candidatus Woesearchaeota archaeon]
MESDLKSIKKHNTDKFSGSRFADAGKVADAVLEKHKDILASILVHRPDGDKLEMMFIIDDFNNVVFAQQAAEVKIFAAGIAYDNSLSVQSDSMIASDVWKSFKNRDDKIMDVFRNSYSIHDNGFFLPLQDLLVKGKVRPSKESVNIYFLKADRSMKTANQNVGRAVIDLYWAVTDAAHAAVMVAGMTPPSPNDLAKIVKDELVRRNLVHSRCAKIVENIHDTAKRIMHREVFEISGREYDAYLSDVDFFLKEIDAFVRKHAGGM